MTLDRDGMAWADAAGNSGLFPARPRQVCDITGAGDMVLAALGYMIAAGADYAAAIEVANTAGGLEVERLGVVPLTRQEILDELSHGVPGAATEHKILSIEQMESQLRRLRQAGQRVVMTNGCFDLLHPGHVALLQEARKQGDCLLVGLNSDRSARELKGAGHPIVDQQGRAEMLAALACVDYVVVFDDVERRRAGRARPARRAGQGRPIQRRASGWASDRRSLRRTRGHRGDEAAVLDHDVD